MKAYKCLLGRLTDYRHRTVRASPHFWRLSLTSIISDLLRGALFVLALTIPAGLFAQANPTLTSITPDTAVAGTAGFTFNVLGSNLSASSVVYWNATALSTTFQFSAGVTAFVPASLVSNSGTAQISVQNPGPVSSNSIPFTIVVTPAIPNFTGASPTFQTIGLAPKFLYVTGTGIQPGVALRWNGITFSGQIGFLGYDFVIPSYLMQTPGNVSLTLINPGGSPSNTLILPIPPLRTLTSMSPSTVASGNTPFTLTVNGSNFAAGDSVVIGGRPLTTQFISSSQLQASVPASIPQLASPGAKQIAVFLTGPPAGTGGPPDFNKPTYSSANFLTLTVGPPGCTYSLSAAEATVGTAASSGTVQVTTQAGCNWTATSPSNSVAITAGANSSGNGVVSYSVAASNTLQTTTLTIAGQPFTVYQLAGCLFGVTPSSAQVAVGGGGGTFGIGTLQASCSWTAASNVPWLQVSGAGAGSGNGTINYTVLPNASAAGRTGTITAGGQIFTVVQAGAAPCIYSLTQASQAFASGGGNGIAGVQTQAGCTFAATSNVQWLTVTGTANGTASYTVAANPAATTRTGSLTIAGLTYSVTQAGTASNLACSASAPAPSSIALEGRTEILGDVEVSCTGLTAPVTVDISLTLNTDVTNRLTGSTTDSTLLVNEANPQNGQIQGYNTLRWPGVSLVADASGTATVRITNVRADASLLAAPSNLQSVAATGVVDVESQTPVPVSNARVTMANATSTLVFQKGAPQPPTGGFLTNVSVTYGKATPAAFQAGVTRLRLVISNIPSTVAVFAPVFPNEGNSLTLELLSTCPGGTTTPTPRPVPTRLCRWPGRLRAGRGRRFARGTTPKGSGTSSSRID